MQLLEQTYSVLLVSASENLNTALKEMMSASVFTPVDVFPDLSSAKRAFALRQYDVVIVNSPLADDSGIRFAIDSSSGSQTVSLILVKAESFSEITDRVSPHGVFTVEKPLSRPTLQAALRWLISARERLRKTEKKALSLEEKMEEIRIVNRAKWKLIEGGNMDESTAHRYIEKQAMDRCVTRRTIAEEILSGNTNFG